MASFSGKTKITLCKRLGNDWQDLADYFEIPSQQFEQGRECQAIWEWLEKRDKLQELHEALRFIKRDDLLSVLQLSQSISHDEVMQEKTTSASTPDNQIDKQRLITLLLDCPSLRNTETRSSLLKMLPHHIVDHIRVGNTIKEYVINIVDGCMNYSDGLQHLFAAIRFFDKKTIQFQALIREFNLAKNESPPTVIGDIEKTITALMAQLHLSAQMRASDEFTRHNQDSLQLIREAMVQLKQLSPQTPEYGRVSLSVGSALASTGELLQAERLFTQIIENTDNSAEKALAHFNLFQVQLRREVYPEALENLQAAIEINPHYALHDLDKYPLERLLGAGGMGCVFLCQNHNHSNRLLAQHERVVVKCFWEHPKGTLDEVFKEPLAMRDIAGDYIPEPLDIGYADTIKRERAYFVTAYIDDAIDGEVWLEKYGPMDLETGLQVGLQIAKGLQIAHDAGICHLDLKPANILLKQTDKEIAVRIIDFGLSQVVPSLQQKAMTVQSRAGLSQFGQAIFGTLDYACPEQQGFTQYGKPGVQCDVFAFGTTMYHFLTGEIPRTLNPKRLTNAPSDLFGLLCDCVEKKTQSRPKSALELINRLKGIKEVPKAIQRTEKAKKEQQQTKTDTKKQLQAIIEQEEQAKRQAEADKEEDKQAWQMACKIDSIAAYQTYLNGNTLKQFANEAKKRLLALKEEGKLSALNPLDYLRLLWWILVMPQQLVDHRKRFGNTDDRRVGKWLVSTLTWLPLLMPSLALGLEWLPHSNNAWSPETYWWTSVELVGCWLLVGWLGDLDEDFAIFVAIVVAFVVAFVVAIEVTSDMENGVAIVVAIVVAIIVASVVKISVYDIVSGVASSVASGVAAVMAFGVASDMAIVVAIIIAVLVVVAVASVIGFIETNLTTDTPSWLARWLARFFFLLLITAHIFLIYYCFLGGWRLFV
jgi:serine/threonine protein kinase